MYMLLCTCTWLNVYMVKLLHIAVNGRCEIIKKSATRLRHVLICSCLSYNFIKMIASRETG